MRVVLQASAASGLLLTRTDPKCPDWTQSWCNEANGNDIIGLTACVSRDAMTAETGSEDAVQCRAKQCSSWETRCEGPSLAQVGAVQFDSEGNKLTPNEAKVLRKSVSPPETPAGIQSLDMDAVHQNVVCSPDVPDWMQLTFNAMMSCSVPVVGKALKKIDGDEAAPTPMCATYAEGGANDEFSHDFCRELYGSMEEYKKCACKRWSSELTQNWQQKINNFPAFKRGYGEAEGFEAQHYQDLVPMRRCPIVVQPRCLFGKMYRSECDALMANQDDPAGKEGLYEAMKVIAPAVWKEDVPEKFRNKTVWDEPNGPQQFGC